MAKQDAIQDNNQVFALIAHSGTAGTAETVRLVANSSGQLQTTASVSAPGTQIVQGADASGAASTNDPVLMGGTDAGGTVYAMKVDTNGVVQTNASLALDTGTLTTGSLANIGQVHNAGTVNALPDLPGGTVDLVTRIGNIGTIESGTVTTTLELNTGTITTGSLSNIATLHNGTVVVSSLPNANVASGTQQTLGTVGVVNNLVTGTVNRVNNGTLSLVSTVSSVTNVANVTKGTITRVENGTIGQVTSLSVGTIGGKAASGAAASQNPVFIAGTDAGGTVYGLKVDTNGVLQTSASLALDSGTITTGSLANIATLHNGTVVVSALNDDLNGGTIDLVSQANVSVGTFTADIPGGTMDLVSTVSSVTNLAAGTITAVNSLPDLPGGTVDLLSNIAGGTVQVNQVPVNSVTSTHVLGTGGTIFGTLLAPTGAGTTLYLAGISIVGHSGTCDYAITNNVAGSTGNGVFARGFFAPGGGIMREFDPPINMGTNGTIAYLVNGNGTASFTANYWKSS